MVSVQLLMVDLSELFCVLCPKSNLRARLMPMDFAGPGRLLGQAGCWDGLVNWLAKGMGRLRHCVKCLKCHRCWVCQNYSLTSV